MADIDSAENGSGSEASNGFEVLDDNVNDEVDSTTDVCFKKCLESLRNNRTLTDILFWRDPRKTGLLFVFGLLVLLSLMWFSFISVVAYFGLSVLLASIGMKAYCRFMNCHSFNELQEREIVLTREDLDAWVQRCLPYFNSAMDIGRRVLRFEDSTLTLKVIVGLFVLSFIGGLFDLLTLLTLDYVLLFFMPPIYEHNREQINAVLPELLKKAKSTFDQATDAAKKRLKKNE